MKNDVLNNLIRLIDKIKNIEGVRCDMVHERVAIDASSKLPIPNWVEKNSFKRNSLCPSEVRNKRLACGHTDVRNILKKFLSELKSIEEFDKTKIENLHAKLDKTDLDICLLDHKKGDAELRYAMKLNEVYQINKGMKNPDAIILEDLKDEKAEIKKLEATHRNYVTTMLELKNENLETVNKVIDKNSV